MARRQQTQGTKSKTPAQVDPGAAASLFRALPAIDKLLQHGAFASESPATALPAGLRATLAREAVASVRSAILQGQVCDAEGVETAVGRELVALAAAVLRPQLRRLYNGSGVLLMTNAGRAPLSAEAIAEIAATAAGFCNLELDLGSGNRGSRQALLRPLLRWLGEAEDGLVVNNGAAALMLALHALAAGRPVVVSRGELVEIGGSFRVPDVMTAAGARLVEVGTTNRTHARDYAAAVADLAAQGTPAALLLQIHRSNFEQVGFVATPSIAELAAIADDAGIPLVVDLGSGAVDGMQGRGLRDEPEIAASLAAGAHLVTASGDKLLGGPQAGLLLGQAALVQRCGRAPMARALRPCKLTLAALDATLRAHLRGDRADLPLWRAVERDLPSLEALGARLAAATTATLRDVAAPTAGAVAVEVAPSDAAVGGGAQAGASLSSRALVLRLPPGRAQSVADALRALPEPWIGRVRADAVWLDLRSLCCSGDDDALVVAWIRAIHMVFHDSRRNGVLT